jgi:CO/xanthine dehydrogenase Mo-binding subunit/aerobic-type carbon monoxide dehydrogenase small subunit (CoxS/CutS family)
MPTYSLRVNGTKEVVETEGGTPLIFVLRNVLGLCAAKMGCDSARQCGACAVLCDGEVIASCSTSISEVGSREITTAEGIGSREKPTRLQLALFEAQASQCGYCIPGIVVRATALLVRNPNPSESDIRSALDRSICRCGSHPRILAAVKRAARSEARISSDIWPPKTTTVASPPSDLEVARQKSVSPKSSEAWLTVEADGSITAYSGKVDMGTGLRTALAQIVADELDVNIDRVALVMSDTLMSPEQGKSTASCGLAIGGQPLRIAAAAVRTELITRAAARLGFPVEDLETRDGTIRVRAQPQESISYGKLVEREPVSVPLDVISESNWGPQLAERSVAKPRASYRYVGKPIRRDVLADHILGSFTYVHNVVVPGMLHGRVVRPPRYFADLLSVDEDSIAHLPDVQIVRRSSFLGVVAEREEIAVAAAERLQAQWSAGQSLYEESRQFEELRAASAVKVQTGFSVGDAPKAIQAAAQAYEGDFHFGYQLHAMIGPSCAVADVGPSSATIWSGTQWPEGDRIDLATMLALPSERVRVIYTEAAGSYGRLGCDDAAADAALMSQIVGRPVRVQWSRRDENGWEPVGTAMTMNVKAGLDANGNLNAMDYTQWCSTHASAERGDHVAWRLIGTAPGNDRLEGYLHGLHYDLEHKRGRTVFVPPTLRTLYLRGPGSVQSHFAIECTMDELARRAGADPMEYRLRYLPERDREVLETLGRISGWRSYNAPREVTRGGHWQTGRGLAYTRSGLLPTSVGAVVDLQVDINTGEIAIDSVCMAHDCGYMINPDGVLNQVQGNIVHALSRALFEEVHYSRHGITTLDWNDYRVIRFKDIPRIEIELMQRPNHEPSGAGEPASIPVIAAVANAIRDATGRRLTVAPFTPHRVLAALS